MQIAMCPYCGRENHTSCPELLAECAYCDRRFAEVRTAYQRLVVLDRDVDGVWELAERLAARWQEDGDLESEVIVDRRFQIEAHTGGERRHYRTMAGVSR